MGIPLAVLLIWLGYAIYWDNSGIVLPEWATVNFPELVDNRITWSVAT